MGSQSPRKDGWGRLCEKAKWVNLKREFPAPFFCKSGEVQEIGKVQVALRGGLIGSNGVGGFSSLPLKTRMWWENSPGPGECEVVLLCKSVMNQMPIKGVMEKDCDLLENVNKARPSMQFRNRGAKKKV